MRQPECFVPLRLKLCATFFLKFSTLSLLSDVLTVCEPRKNVTSREADEDDERADRNRQEPSEHLRRRGLKPTWPNSRYCFWNSRASGWNRGACHDGTRRFQHPCSEVVNSPARQGEGSSFHTREAITLRLPLLEVDDRPTRRASRGPTQTRRCPPSFPCTSYAGESGRTGSMHAYRMDDGMPME